MQEGFYGEGLPAKDEEERQQEQVGRVWDWGAGRAPLRGVRSQEDG